MRIKINDKIYRLKEIESGVDSLMELAEEYKDGDFVVSELDSILIFKESDGDGVFDHAFLSATGLLLIDKVASYDGIKRHATTEEKQRMIEALAELGKRWNKDKRCVEDIFKAGDKVRIKHGVSSKTHRYIIPAFVKEMDNLIGKTMTVSGYNRGNGYVVCKGSNWVFHEDWLEPWSDEPKKGDLAIFWDNSTSYAIIRIYDRKDYNIYYDILGNPWKNAIKFESKEQYEKLINGEL